MNPLKNLKRLDAASAVRIILAYAKRRAGLGSIPEDIRLRKIFAFLIENDCELISIHDSYFTAKKKTDHSPEIQFHIREGGFADESVFRDIFSKKSYKTFTDFVLKHSSAGEISSIVDGGANVGFASLFFAGQFPDSRIVSVEPEAGNYKSLELNIHLNGLSGKVSPIQGGLWDESRELGVRSDFRGGTSDSYYLSESGKGEDHVQAYTLAGLAAKHHFNTIDILKLDIEGAERQLFNNENIQQVLAITKFTAIEIHDEFNCRDHIYQVLDNAGFTRFESGELTIGYNRNLLQDHA